MTALGMLMAASVAWADTPDIIQPQGETQSPGDGWQSGTCTTDEPVEGQPNIKCSSATPNAFFKTAGGHPPVGFTQYIIKHNNGVFTVPSPPGPPPPNAVNIPT